MKKTQLLWISYFAFVLIGSQAGALGVAWIHMEKTFNQSLSAIGMLLGALAIGRLIITTNTGRFVGKFGVRNLLAGGIILNIIGYGGFTLLEQWPLIVLCSFLSGLGTASISMSMNTFLAYNYNASRMNWLHACFGLGAIIGPILVTTIVIDLALSWRWNYIVVVVVHLALLVLVMINDWHVDIDTADENRKIQPRDTLKLPIVWYIIALFFFSTGTEITTGQLSNNLLVDGRGIDPKIAGIWVSLYWASFTAGRTVAGFIVGRIPNSTLMRLNLLGVLTGIILIWMDFSLIGLLMMGFSIGPIAPTLISDTPLKVGRGHATNAIGFQFTGGSIALAAMPWLGGLLAEKLGLEIIPPFVLLMGITLFILHELLLIYEKRPILAAQYK